MIVSISAVNPVSPVRYTERPLVNLTMKPFAGSRYAVRPSVVSSVFSGSDSVAAAALLSWFAGTVAISMAGPPFEMVRSPLIPSSAVHAVGRGTVIEFDPLPVDEMGGGGHAGVGAPVIA